MNRPPDNSGQDPSEVYPFVKKTVKGNKDEGSWGTSPLRTLYRCLSGFQLIHHYNIAMTIDLPVERYE